MNVRPILLGFVVSILPISPLLAQSIPIPNPGFEDGNKSWTIPDSDKKMSSISPEAARTGSMGLLVRDNDTATGSSATSAPIPIRPNTGYEVAFQGRILDGNGIGVYLIFKDKTGKSIPPENRFVQSLQTSDIWNRQTVRAVSPANAENLVIWVHSFNQSTVVAQLDDFTLTEISAEAAKNSMSEQTNPQLPNFPKTNPDKAFTEYKIHQPDGSVLRTPVEDWKGALRRTTDDPAWADWLKNQRSSVDKWMANQKDRVEWQSGWWHDFVSPKDGAFLVWTENVPGEGTDHLMSPSGHRVEITQKIFDAWVFGFRSRHFDRMVDAAYLYRLTGEARYAEWVATQLDFYANNYDRWGKNPRQRNDSHLGWQGLEDATWLSTHVEAARLIFDYADPKRRQAWYEKLFKPQAEMLTKNGQQIHNIPTWFRASSAQAALLYKDEDLWARTVEAHPYGLRDQIRNGVTDDYFWFEQSMGYNSYVVMATRRLLVFSGLIGEGKRLRDEASILQNLLIAPMTIRFPDGTIPTPADSSGGMRADPKSLSLIYRILPTTLGVSAAKNIRSWDTLLDPPAAIQDVPASPDLPPVVSRQMKSTQFALMKKGPWQVFFHYGQLHPSHSQNEALNWSASFDGVDISHDTATVGYGSPLHHGYYARGLNHNVPLINGEGQERWRSGNMETFDEQKGIMTGEQPLYRSDVSARRTLRIDGDRLIDEASVTFKGTNPDTATLGLTLHLQGEPQLPKEFKPATDFAKGRPSPFAQWRDVQSASFTNEAVVEVSFPQGKTLLVRFATPGAFTLYQASAPDIPPRRRTVFYLEKTEPAKEATFTTEFSPKK